MHGKCRDIPVMITGGKEQKSEKNNFFVIRNREVDQGDGKKKGKDQKEKKEFGRLGTKIIKGESLFYDIWHWNRSNRNIAF